MMAKSTLVLEETGGWLSLLLRQVQLQEKLVVYWLSMVYNGWFAWVYSVMGL